MESIKALIADDVVVLATLCVLLCAALLLLMVRVHRLTYSYSLNFKLLFCAKIINSYSIEI